jgi:hypothetical protein
MDLLLALGSANGVQGAGFTLRDEATSDTSSYLAIK